MSVPRDFLEVLRYEELSNANYDYYLHVIGISSPTGWDEKVISHIAGEDFLRTYTLRNFIIILVDQSAGKIYYPKAHPLAEGYSNLFKPETNYESEARVKRWIAYFYDKAYARTPGFAHVSLSEIMKSTNADLETCLKVLNDLETERYGEVERSADGRIIFHYLKSPKDWR